MSKRKHPSSTRRLEVGLDEVAALMQRKRWREARTLLESLDRRYPNRVEVLTDLANVCLELRDTKGYEAACERLLKITPDNPDAALGLAGAYMSNIRPVSALRTFRRFLERFPNHPRAGEVRTTVAELEARLDEMMRDIGLTGADDIEIAALHEQAQSLLEQGKFAQACQVEEELLRRRPDFAPALNNISQTYFVQGQLKQAIATSERVLTFAPDNFHALSNLTRYLCLSGRMDEARRHAEHLKAIQSDAVDVWIKKAEALTYLGDDQGVLDAFDGAERAERLKPPLGDPVLFHFAAVAALRLGKEDVARRHWQHARKLAPWLQEVQGNLADLRQPIGKRHAPWAFGIRNWITEQAVSDLYAALKPVTRRGEAAATQAARRYLAQHPEMVPLVPLLLDRGDPQAREFALNLAQMAETPEILAALRDFALSQRGPDEMRMQAARAASRAGLLPRGTVRFWVQGEWREILLMDFEIYSEPESKHSPQVEKLMIEGTMAVRRGDAKQAEHLLKQALQIEPDAPDVLNNLAAAYELQGRMQEAERIVHQIYQRHPDYLFARTSLARLNVKAGKLDQAQALLEPLFHRRRLHTSEFAALCTAQIEVLIAKRQLDGARSWLQMFARVDPDNPAVARFRRELRGPGIVQRLWRR